MNITNKVVLLTGAAGGLGTELVKLLVKEKCKLIIVDNSMKKLEELVSKMELPEEFIIKKIEADLTKSEDVFRIYTECNEGKIDVDIIINNAGIIAFGKLSEIPEDKIRNIMEVNLMAPIFLIKLFINDFEKRKCGHIVNVASIAGIIGLKKFLPYSVSKFGVRGLGEVLRNEYKKYNIKVSTVYPYYINTGIIENCDKYGKYREVIVSKKYMDDTKNVALEIVSGIKKEKKNIYPGKNAKLMNFLQKYSPAIVGRMS